MSKFQMVQLSQEEKDQIKIFFNEKEGILHIEVCDLCDLISRIEKLEIDRHAHR